MKRARLALAIVTVFAISAASAHASTVAELQAQLQGLIAKLATLQTQARTTPALQSGTATCPDLERNLSRGSRGADVTLLQLFLISQNLLARDSATGFYGSLTETSIKRWQAMNGLVSTGSPATTGYGAVGPRTRTALKRCDVLAKASPPVSTPPTSAYSPPSGTLINTDAAPRNPATQHVASDTTTPPPLVTTSTFVTPEAYGAKGDGLADDTAALQSAIGGGRSVKLTAGKTYRISKGLRLESGTTVYSDGAARIWMESRTGGFVNTDPAKQVDIDSAALWGHEVSDVTLAGFHVEKELDARHIVSAVIIRGGTNITIAELEANGFSKANGIIRLDSINGGIVRKNRIHDSTTADDFQLTAISVDGDRLTGADGTVRNSENILIEENAISRLTVSADMAARSSYETDGISIMGASGSKDIRILNNEIIHVGEGIDVFGNGMIISDNYIYEPYALGVKLIHGASDNVVSRNRIFRPGMGGIGVFGSNAVSVDSVRNTIIENKIYDPGRHPTAPWNSNTRFGIGILLAGPLGKPLGTLVESNLVSGTERVSHAILCEQSGNTIGPNTIENTGNIAEPIRHCP